MKRISLVAGLVAIAALAACNQEAAAPAGGQIITAAFNNATVQQTGNVIDVTRNGEGPQGVMIVQAPVLVHFTVEGENAQLRLTRNNRFSYLPVQADNAIMIGRTGGAAQQVLVVSDNAETLKVTITSVIDCATAEPGVCVPPPEGTPPPRAAAPAAASPAAAPAAAPSGQ